MSESRCRDLLFAHLRETWTRSPILTEGQRGTFDPDDVDACAAYTPPARFELPGEPFQPEHVRGAPGIRGVGYAVVGFDEIDRDGAFLGRTGWKTVRLHLVVDLYAPESGDTGPIEESADAVRDRFDGFGVRDQETDSILKADPEEEPRLLTFAPENGWHRAQVRVSVELKIPTSNPTPNN